MKAFLQEYDSQFLSKAVEHFYISMFVLLLAIVVAVPLGILLLKTQRTANTVLTVVGVLQTIPILTVLVIMISILGVGETSAIVVLLIYVLLPILDNIVLGIKNIDKNVIQASQSMGAAKLQLMKDVEMSLVLPLIISGTRLSSVYVIGWATLASYVGVGGLEDPVFNGLSLYQPLMITSAAIVVTLLALATDLILSLVEKRVIPKGLEVFGQMGGINIEEVS